MESESIQYCATRIRHIREVQLGFGRPYSPFGEHTAVAKLRSGRGVHSLEYHT